MLLGDLIFLHKYYELHIQVFILIKYLSTSCGYELLVTRCHGHELHVNRYFGLCRTMTFDNNVQCIVAKVDKGQNWVLTSRSTARVILGQVLSIATCGSRTHTQR